MSDQIDKVAEAIWSQHGLFGPHRWDVTDATRDRYRRMGQAAVDALQLTQEWKTVHESGGGYIHHSYAEAREEFDSFVERPPGFEDHGSGRLTHIAERFVSPWVVVGHLM